MSQCTTDACCEEQDTCCPVEKSIKEGSCCPVDKSIEIWSQSFFQAMKGAQVDILKEKIRKNWGPVLDQQADAVLAAMGTHWHAMLAQGKAQAELRENMKNILKSVKN
jgi:hypothetical protein